ncbi:hypothetical protein EVAR_11371_1 [Eumeta japonica]|uniref:Uncharacterized protein n=1 Tax=Eumeta variegata TaxID=151549 RepID=A0A4C1U0W4_EUMVA|nr:hypothetical protein EVAR_11371_1 [Eumeta japonica]
MNPFASLTRTAGSSTYRHWLLLYPGQAFDTLVKDSEETLELKVTDLSIPYNAEARGRPIIVEWRETGIRRASLVRCQVLIALIPKPRRGRHDAKIDASSIRSVGIIEKLLAVLGPQPLAGKSTAPWVDYQELDHISSKTVL